MNEKREGSPLAARRRQLSQYRYLMREIREGRLYLAQLTGRLLRSAPAVEDIAEMVTEEAKEARERLSFNLERCEEVLRETEAYINAIKDSQIRYIFTLRYLRAYSWRRIAYAIGGYEESYARKKHDRYIEKNL